MKYLKIACSGVLAGIFIGLGSFAFVACVSLDAAVGKILGSLLFSVGLLCVCFFGASLYTGRVGFAFEQKPNYVLELLAMLAGNFIGAAGSGSLVYLACSSGSNSLVSVAQGIASSRAVSIGGSTGETWYKALIMAIFCGMLVFMAVYIWKKAENWAIKATGLILCVWAFVVTGTEHCIANMFYFALAWAWSLGNFLNVLICIVGNSIGSWLIWLIIKAMTPKAPSIPQAK